jgi:hypothetical protein
MVLCALLVGATASRAAAPNYTPGKGGVGGLLGGSYYRMDRTLGSAWFGDYSEGAQARLAFTGQFRYVVRPHWRWQIGPGLTWSAYRDVTMPFPDLRFPDDTHKSQVLTVAVPVTAQLQYTLHRGWWLYHGGGGVGLYRVWVENHRQVLRDPRSLEVHRGVHPGIVAQLGAERFVSGITDMSVEFAFASHLVFAQNHDNFPSGFDSNLMINTLQIGVNYYFDLVRPKSGTRPPAGVPEIK